MKIKYLPRLVWKTRTGILKTEKGKQVTWFWIIDSNYAFCFSLDA